MEWRGGGWLRKEGMSSLCGCTCKGEAGRQTDRQSECVAECRSESWGKRSHRNTVCLVVMVQSNTAHFFSLGEPDIFWLYFRSVLVCIDPGHAHAYLTCVCGCW